MLDTHDQGVLFVPLDCPVCGLMMRDLADGIVYFKGACCSDCWVTFVEPIRKIKLDDEYLPSSEEIKNYRDKLIALNTYIEDESQES